MKRIIKLSSTALFVLLFCSCDNNLVSRAEYDAALSRADSLEAHCDSLQIENAELHLYNDYLEAKLDSCETLEK